MKRRHPYLNQMARHLSLLGDPEFGLDLAHRKEYQDCIIDDRGIYCGMQWEVNHPHVSRIRVLLTGADLYMVTVWRPYEIKNVIDLHTQQPIKVETDGNRQTIDRIFTFDLNNVLLYLFGWAERPKTDGKSFNIDVNEGE